MKFIKTQNTWKSPNVTLNMNDLTAYSYKWWLFLTKIGDKVVFNNYSYSVTTSKHQSKVLGILDHTGIKIDLFIEAPKGLQDLDRAKSHYQDLIQNLTTDMLTKRLRQATKERNLVTIEEHKAKIVEIEKLMKVQG